MSAHELDAVIEAASMGGFFDAEDVRKHAELALDAFLEAYERHRRQAQSSLHSSAWLRLFPPLSKDSLFRAMLEHSSRATVMLQGIASAWSPEILVMVWMVLYNATIEAVEFSYRERSSFEMKVTLRWRDQPLKMEFISQDIFDASVLRHFGIMKADGDPLFHDIVPMRVD